MVGYWPLHDDSATDYSGNGNHGSLNGGVTTGVAGKGGLQAMSFDGSDDYVEIPDQSYLRGGDNLPICVSFWFNVDNLSSDQQLVQKQWDRRD